MAKSAAQPKPKKSVELAQLRHLRPSLRANVVLMALAMLLLPQVIVVGWSLMERDIGGKLQWETKASSEEAASQIAADDGHVIEAHLMDVAARWGTRIRIVREDGEVLVDVDADRGTDLVHQIGTLFFGPDGAPTLREFDETLHPIEKRPEVIKVTGWTPPPMAIPPAPMTTTTAPTMASAPSETRPPVETGCRSSPAGKLLVCHAARPFLIDGDPHVIYAQESSRRAVRVLYDLRYHLARLSIMMLPFALIFSWWMGRRMVRPIEWLRERVLEKAKAANPQADIDLRGGEEVRDLADAFNGLLGALDEKRRANEAFVADLVHELKNPVAAIQSCAESLQRGGADAQRAARIAKILQDSSGRLDALVSQFLELARAEAGMPNEDRTEVDLGALAEGVVTNVKASFEGVRFVVDAEPARVTAVATRLDSVVRNLVDNAASFAGEDGEVSVVVRALPNEATIEVTDTGPGIAETDLPKVFDRFFTKRSSTRESIRKGTGLGLALVKAIALAHGGTVSVQSTPGKGATFRVTLPRSS